MQTVNDEQLAELARTIKSAGEALGFEQIGISGTNLAADQAHLTRWLSLGRHGEMDYMARHGTRRSRPDQLVPGTVRVISARMNNWPAGSAPAEAVLGDPGLAYISRYALGRDYHKVMRRRLQKLADTVESICGPFGYRVFVDSAPVLEKALARNAGIGWIGKHTNLINRNAGSWFFLGEIYTDLPLPEDLPTGNHCGTCRVCLDVCPTNAIVAPYELDARRCISYLTIELRGSIPVAFRRAIGNRIFGCDDCQLFCPWNKFAGTATVADFSVRHGLDAPALTELFSWSEAQWRQRTEGSALRRPGYDGWLRNIAVALGNADGVEQARTALTTRLHHGSEMVREHVRWALDEQDSRSLSTPS